jgi:branched-chain amino acid aminotransferase
MPCPINVMIASWEWGAYLGEDALLRGARLITSAWVRLPANAMPGKAKAGGNYVNSALARMDAVSAGFDEALLLDQNGFVAEGSGENIFFVRDGRLHVIASSVNLVGITRASVLEIAREMGLEIQEVMATRDQLYTADEVFMTGTAAEVTPVSEIDHRPIGSGRAGPVSLELRRRYLQAVEGRDERYAHWLTYVNG